jgi:hypothetical protein
MSCLVTTEPQWSIHDQDAATLKIWRKFQKKGKQSILHVDNYGRRPKDFAPLIYEDTRGKVAPSTKLWVLTFGYDNSMLKMAFLLIILYNSPTFGDDSRDTFGPQHTRFNLLKAHKWWRLFFKIGLHHAILVSHEIPHDFLSVETLGSS